MKLHFIVMVSSLLAALACQQRVQPEKTAREVFDQMSSSQREGKNLEVARIMEDNLHVSCKVTLFGADCTSIAHFRFLIGTGLASAPARRFPATYGLTRRENLPMESPCHACT